jgi:hypothetical protein
MQNAEFFNILASQSLEANTFIIPEFIKEHVAIVHWCISFEISFKTYLNTEKYLYSLTRTWCQYLQRQFLPMADVISCLGSVQ